jgi:hypothetical protein
VRCLEYSKSERKVTRGWGKGEGELLSSGSWVSSKGPLVKGLVLQRREWSPMRGPYVTRAVPSSFSLPSWPGSDWLCCTMSSLPWWAASQQAWKQWGNKPQTESSKTMSQNKPSLLKLLFSDIYQ